jgi:hypothetical protein
LANVRRGIRLDFMESSLIWGTWALVGVTLVLVWVTFWMFRQQRELLRGDLKVRLQLTFIERFDSDRMKHYRGVLAQRLLANAPHNDIQEDVMNFFEDLDLFLVRGYLDEELAWETFGFYAVRWWAACNDYILEECKRNNDLTLFTGFKDLVDRFSTHDVHNGLKKPSSEDIEQFLQGEQELPPKPETSV